MREELDQMKQQLMALKAEDAGWMALYGGQVDSTEGLTLDQLKEWSKLLREAVAGSPLPKNANAIRYSYTFSEPFLIPELTKSIGEPAKPGRPPKLPPLGKFYENKVNQRYVFGKEAQELISTACSTDSMYIALGDDKTRELRPIPLAEIVGVYVNPDFQGEVWAYQRRWTRPSTKGKTETVSKWYYTDQFEGVRASSLADSASDDGAKVPVDKDKTIIDFRVNQQVGWSFGSPDLMAGHLWNKKYVKLMNHGEEISTTLAFYAAKVRTAKKDTAKDYGVQVGSAQRAGATVGVGEGNDIDVFSSAGKVYDFAGLNYVAGMYASSVGISLVDLLSNPNASGSSYGAAKALDPATRRGIESRRAQVAGWMERVLKWGTGKDIQVTPASIEEVDPYRHMQMVRLAEQTGLYHPEELRPVMAYLAGLTLLEDTYPEGYLQPNNEASWERSDIDPKDGPSGGGTSPGQGQSTGDGGTDSALTNDNRDDQIA